MRGDEDQVADLRNRRVSIFSSITLLKMARTNNTRFGRNENALGWSWSWSGSVALVIFSSWLLYAEVSAWYIKFSTMKLSAEEIAFFLHCAGTQQCSKFLFLKQNTTWKQAIRFFIEFGTVARLEERTEYCKPALWATQSTITIFLLHARCSLLTRSWTIS